MNKLIFFLGSIIFLLLFGCSKAEEEITDLDYEAEFAIPVIKNATLTFTELWQNNDPNQSLLVKPDGGLVFRYASEEVKVTTEDILGELEFPIIAPLPDSVSILPFQLPANIIVEEALLSGGILVFQFQPIKDGSVEITFELPQITSNGEPVMITTGAFSGSTVPIDLAGYTFRPTNNELLIKYTAKDQVGNPVVLQNASIITRPKLTFVKGTWGREEFQLNPATVAIDLYDERFLNGNIRFAEPTITATIESSFGVPIRSRIDILNAQTKLGIPMPIDATAIDGVDINYPRLEERGESKKTVLQLDYTNSNIVEVFDAQLTEVKYGLTAIANPDNNPILVSFVEDTSTFKAQVLVEVPVVGRARNFVATEQFEVPFSDIDKVAEGEFKLIVANSLPVGAQLQFYFKDANNQVIDSLFQAIPQLVESAVIDQEGNVIKATETTTFILVTATKMQHIIEATELQVKATFQTAQSGSQDVIIQADQQLHFKIGLKFKVE